MQAVQEVAWLLLGLAMSDTNLSTKISVKNIDETKLLAENFAKSVLDKVEKIGKGTFVCLFGDIGSGKTAFSRFVADKMGVKEKVTSPSFVILNEYHTSKIPIYHFDLYRLEDVGVKSIIDELEQYSEGKMLTLVEWAEFSQNQIPFDRVDINIKYEDENSRTFEFVAYGEENENIIRELSL